MEAAQDSMKKCELETHMDDWAFTLKRVMLKVPFVPEITSFLRPKDPPEEHNNQIDQFQWTILKLSPTISN